MLGLLLKQLGLQALTSLITWTIRVVIILMVLTYNLIMLPVYLVDSPKLWQTLYPIFNFLLRKLAGTELHPLVFHRHLVNYFQVKTLTNADPLLAGTATNRASINARQTYIKWKLGETISNHHNLISIATKAQSALGRIQLRILAFVTQITSQVITISRTPVGEF